MRYYDIKIYQPNTKTLVRQFTSHPIVNGAMQADPGALNVLLDMYLYSADAATQLPVIKIWGVSIQDVMQASNFWNCDIEVSGGFQKGLPLNNPKQAGPLFKGTIFQSFANWSGLEMTLDFVLANKGSVAAQRSNISLQWLKGSSLATVLASTLAAAFPGVKQTINISSKLVATHDISGHYFSMVELNQALRPATQEMLGTAYPGVSIVQTPQGISVMDGGVLPGAADSTPTFTYNGTSYPVVNGNINVPATLVNETGFINAVGTPSGITQGVGGASGTGGNSISTTTINPDANGNLTVTHVIPNGSQQVPTTQAQPSDASRPPQVQLEFQDFIGQPVWIDPGTIQFVCPMRADLTVGSEVLMPKGYANSTNSSGSPGLVTTTAAAMSSQRQSSLFSGAFQAREVHHMGEFRNPDGQAWVTVFLAIPAAARPTP